MTPRTRPALSLAHGEPDQVPRLTAFRRAHPKAVIGTLGSGGPWQARIPGPSGETVAARYTLRELLDRLDELMAEDPQ